MDLSIWPPCCYSSIVGMLLQPRQAGIRLTPMPKRKKVKKFDQKNEVRAIARERVGIVPGSRVLDQKEQRKKPKYKKDPEVE